MSVTEQDLAEARALWGHCMDHEGERGAVELIAAALADERDRARAPFAALAEELPVNYWAAVAIGPVDQAYRDGFDAGLKSAADDIRRAAGDPQ